MIVAPPLIRRALYDGWDFGLRLQFFEGAMSVMRQKQYNGWLVRTKGHPAYGCWRVSRQVIDDRLDPLINDLAECAGDRASADIEVIRSVIAAARSRPDVSLFTHGVKVRIFPLVGQEVAISGTYHPGIVALAKNMGGRYLSAMTAWRLPNATPATVHNNVQEWLRLDDDQIELFDGTYGLVEGAFVGIKPNDVGIEVGTAPIEGEGGAKPASEDSENDVYLAVTSAMSPTRLDMREVQARIDQHDLLEHQREGVMHLVRNTSSLLADDMGLGKSRQAVVAADILANAAGDQILVGCPASLVLNWEREIRIIDPKATIARQQYKPDVRWIVMNYERFEGLLPHAARFKVMINDEAQALKEPTSQRTRLVFDVAAKIPHRFILTGTPILNRECEIHTLLRLSGHPVGSVPLGEFEKQFAGDSNFRVQLNQRIREWMLRRSKDMVLKHLKGKRRQVMPVQASVESRETYERLLRDPDLQGLEKVSRIRAFLEEIKVDSIVEMIEQLQGDDKVIVFTEFRKTVTVLKARLDEIGWKAVTMTGDDSPTKRQKAVDAFQQDAECRAFIGTTLAAGVGITLTAANYVMFASLPWTPALLEQAEDRAYRLGQQRLVIVKIPQVEDTIDSKLWELLKHKKVVATEVLSPADVATELARMHLAAATA